MLPGNIYALFSYLELVRAHVANAQYISVREDDDKDSDGDPFAVVDGPEGTRATGEATGTI